MTGATEDGGEPDQPELDGATSEASVFAPVGDLRSQSKSATVTEPSRQQQSVAGTVAAIIGTGQNAKDSVVYLTIQWSFAVASVATVMVLLHDFWVSDSLEVPNLKDIWTVFIPIITLGLGYMFGKERD